MTSIFANVRFQRNLFENSYYSVVVVLFFEEIQYIYVYSVINLVKFFHF